MKNFKNTVPDILAARIKELVEAVDFSEMVSGWKESHSEQTLREIEGNYVSGWMPKQDGGFAVEQFYRSDIDSSFHFTEKQSEFVAEQQEQCFKSFLHDNGIEDDGFNDVFDSLTDEQKEAFYEYENDWFSDSALLSFEVFCNGYTGWKNEEETVTIRLSINYQDAPYYREGFAEDIKCEILTVEEFLAEDVTAIIERFKI